MCDKCAELDKKIEHYRSLLFRVTDQQTTERIRKLINDMRAPKGPRFIPSNRHQFFLARPRSNVRNRFAACIGRAPTCGAEAGCLS
jgi:hypothetical protein